MKSIFKIGDYREVIEAQLKANFSRRGQKAELAKKTGIQPSYLSQCLSGTVHLSVDQAANMAEHWGFNDLEVDYFLNLVVLARATSPVLVRRLREKLAAQRRLAEDQKFNYDEPSLNERERASIYYSHYLPSLIHMLLTIPSLQRSGALALHLSLPEAEVRRALEDLAQIGLARHAFDRWLPELRSLHAANETVFARAHHRNWRLQASEAVMRAKETDLRYTAVHSLSHADFKIIREQLLVAIENARKVVTPSPEQTGACLLLDWYQV